MGCNFSGVPDKIELCFVEHPTISSSSVQAEMDSTHIMITPLKFFDWKVDMVIQLRAKGIFRVTMGIEVEPNSVVEKAKYFNKLMNHMVFYV